ncbi:MAG: GPR endopeptidase, partial [Tissierellia bacterium]|nr:GPR endopeptidase [Tissierellia bacterium]
MIDIRTDLAIESREMYQEQEEGEIPGIDVESEEGEYYDITRVRILDKAGEESLGRPKGNYITIEAPQLKQADQELKDNMSKLLA